MPHPTESAASQRIPVDVSRLQRVGRRPSLGEYLQRLWRCRHYLAYDAGAGVQAMNRGHRLGNVWLVLTPLLNGATYFLIFGVLLQTSRGVPNFLGYLTIGVFMFTFTSRVVTAMSRALTARRNVADAFQLPHAVLPIGALLRETLMYGFTLAAMLFVILVIPPHAELTWRWLLFPAVVLLQVLLVTGVGLVLARMVSRVRDIGQLVGFLLRLWMYGSAVFYSFDRFVHHPRVLAVLEANPMYQVLDLSRSLLLYGHTPALGTWASLTAWAVGSFVVGILVIWQGEERYGRNLHR
ncbi:ABC transporter permease [Micrococcus sp.]|uniref:ABC transporter permease n=1 Tax=Micrococcus sp. TaxID=1271 RepID=UPI002A917CC5|nr:ABC transporter permease [Micrococcus sp.]MDY6054290.1 ABC transporter permease [Micrococcus sp.]